MGQYAGYTGQGHYSIAMGQNAGNKSQGPNSIALGLNAGNYKQEKYSIAIGQNAGYTSQGINSIAMGRYAGQYLQGTQSIAMGGYAGKYTQGLRSIAIGLNAGLNNQGGLTGNSIAIGQNAGYTGQGPNSIAIGNNAGYTSQHNNTIILNAQTNNILNSNSAKGFYVAPISKIPNSIGVTGVLYYNETTKEIKYNPSKTFVIDHPLDNDKYLVHSCLEGPEAGVYYRGKGEIINNESVTISLPNYVSKLAFDLFVQITPIYNGKLKLYNVSDVENNEFKVYGENGKFNWTVFGSRSNIEVEPNKNSVQVKGDGPYKWI